MEPAVRAAGRSARGSIAIDEQVAAVADVLVQAGVQPGKS